MLRTSWAYSLKREELVKYLGQVGKDSAGNVDELRKRFAKFLSSDHTESELKELLELQSKHEATSNSAPTSPMLRLQIPLEASSIPTTSPVKVENDNKTVDSSAAATRLPIPPPSYKEPQQLHSENLIMVIELVRKWGLKYDGGKDPLGFIERTEELADMYNIDLDQLPRVMPELFREKALIWFRNNNRHWEKWTAFKADFYAFFLPTRYFEKLEDEIRKRTQRSRESFKEYVLALQDLMRHSNLSENQKIERIFHNAHPDYQWYIRRKDFNTLSELIQLADELECIPTTSQSSRGDHHRMVNTNPDDNKNRFLWKHIEDFQESKNNDNKTCLVWEEDKIKAAVLIEHKLITTIIDTGATRSFITPKQVQRLSVKPLYVSVDIDVLLADGSKKTISKAVRFKVTLGNITAECNFLIMNEATVDIILGLDILQMFDTTFSCAGLIIKSKHPEPSHFHDSRIEKVCSIFNVIKPADKTASVNINEDSNKILNYKMEITRFLERELPKFQNITGFSNIETHKIVMKDDRPVKIRYAQRNPAMQAIIDAEVNKLMIRGCIEPSPLPRSSPKSSSSSPSSKSPSPKASPLSSAKLLPLPESASKSSPSSSSSKPSSSSSNSSSSSSSNTSPSSSSSNSSTSSSSSSNASPLPSSSNPSPISVLVETNESVPSRSTTPPIPTSPKTIPLSQAPEKIKQLINEVLADRKGQKQLRLRRLVKGQHFRILVSRSGNVRILWLQTEEERE